MKISNSTIDKAVQMGSLKSALQPIEKPIPLKNQINKEVTNQTSSQTKELNLESITKERLEEAITAINDFLEVEKKSTKFILHDGLDKYYVRLVDPETEEVIKEIPPESLLNAFYEMKKLAGMIVDEKI